MLEKRLFSPQFIDGLLQICPCLVHHSDRRGKFGLRDQQCCIDFRDLSARRLDSRGLAGIVEAEEPVARFDALIVCRWS